MLFHVSCHSAVDKAYVHDLMRWIAPMEYIKLHAYHEANQDRGDLKHTHHVLRDNIDAEDHSESEDRVRVHLQHRRRRSSVSSMASEGTSSISKSSLLMKAAAAAAATTTEDKIGAPKETAKPSTLPAVDLPSTEPVLMMGVMEVYPSDEEDDEEEYEYVTETDTDGEAEEEEEEEEENVEEIQVKPVAANPPQEANQPKAADTEQASPATTDKDQQDSPSKTKQDDKVDRLKSAYQEIRKERQASPSSLLAKQPFNPQRRVSFVEDTDSPIDISKGNTDRHVDSTAATSTTFDRAPPAPAHQNTQQQVHDQDDEEEEDYEGTSESAAFELDDMLRELDSKRIARSGAGEESTRSYRHPDIKPTASMSSPSLLQQQQQQRRSIPSQYYHQQQQSPSSYQTSGRRMSSIEPVMRPAYSQSGSLQSNNSSSYMDLYDPFNSLSSKETGTVSTKHGSMESHLSKSTTPPSVQLIHERMLKDKQQGSYQGSVSSSSSSGGSVRSIGQQSYHNDKFVQDYYRVGHQQAPAAADDETTKEDHFIDFAFALYDYEASDEGEIGFSEGDLLGIISKNEDEEQGWWEASLLNSRNQKIVRTGLVPSNFLETASSTTK